VIEDKVKYWITISQYDLDTAKAMLETKRYLYVGFMCHQAVEKILKALYCREHNDDAPYTHNLTFLLENTSLFKEISQTQLEFITELKPMNIESRYPEYKMEMFRKLNLETTISYYDRSKEIVEWVKKKL
jgi:HEPN domain-containing protein